MQRLLRVNNWLLVSLIFCVLAIGLTVAFSSPARGAAGFTPQAFQSPIRTPTPLPSPSPSPAPPAACPPQTRWGRFAVDVEVKGLPGAERAMLRLQPISESINACLVAHGVTLPEVALGNGKHHIQLSEIPDGAYYKLTVQGVLSHFREPSGYLFQVQDGQIVFHPGYTFDFRLVPPAQQDLPPCPQLLVNPKASRPSEAAQVICRAEPLIDLSAPPKQPSLQRNRVNSSSSSTTSYLYRYVGPQTDQDSQGVWGRRYVVDPAVSHPFLPLSKQFVVEYSYALGPGPNWYWMEAGWAEVSWRDNQQYIYQFDSNTREWHFFDQFVLGVGSAVETMVEYKPETGTWQALFHLHDNQWAKLAEENLGFTIADAGHNWGEIYMEDGSASPPILPVSRFDKGYLKIDGMWRIWDSRYPAFVRQDPPYKCDMIEEYTNFTIHSPITWLPLIMKDQ